MLLRDNIYDALRAEILDCRIAPGEEMREQELAARYDVSRAPVREALLRLARDHLVTVQPRQGYRVAPISLTDAAELLQLRVVLETACVGVAAAEASNDILRGLDELRIFEPAGDFIAYNRTFHKALATASGNRRMAEAAGAVIDGTERLVRVSLGNLRGREPAQLVAEHGLIIDALHRRDARGAVRLVRDHVSKAERRVLSALARSAILA